MKIPGIKGQTKVDGHADWLPVDSVQWGAGRAVAHASSGRSKREAATPSLSEVTFSRLTDMASPHLFFETCGGKELDTIDIEILQIVDNKPQVFVKIKLEHAYISSYSMSSGGDNPSESVSINFVKMTYQYDTWAGKEMIPGNPRSWDLAVTVGT
jgi:type VI secretion system secreted protein Hcp